MVIISVTMRHFENILHSHIHAKFPVSLQFTRLGLGSISEPCGIVT